MIASTMDYTLFANFWYIAVPISIVSIYDLSPFLLVERPL